MNSSFFSTRYLGRSWWWFLLYGLLSIGVGVIALIQPVTTAIALVWLLAIGALAEAAISLVGLFDRRADAPRGWLLFYAIAAAAFGILALLFPIATAAVLVLFLAAWLIVSGIFRIVFAIRVRKLIRGEWLLIVSGVLAILLGVAFVVAPQAGIVVSTFWFGVLMLVYGILQVVGAFRLRGLQRGLR